VIQRARVSVAIEHTILYRCIGSPAIMAAQCSHLAELVESNVIGLHVVPEGANLGGLFKTRLKEIEAGSGME
jgi:hypothetical protein